MSNQNKFEAMLEKLIADDRSGAEELFHEIVVEKSRDIYENLLNDDVEEVEVDEASKKDDEDEKVEEKQDTADKEDEKVDEATDEEDEEKTDESEDKDDEDAVEEDITDVMPEGGDEMGGDPADDMMADIEGGDEEDKGDEDSEDLEDRVADLEDTFDDLKAEFDAMMADKEGDDEGEEGPEMDDDAEDEGDEEAEEAFEPASDLEVDVAPAFEQKAVAKDNTELMREYVQKVTQPGNSESNANTKSVVASKNDMGGDAGNIAKGGEGGGSESGLTDNSAKEDNAGNVNVPGGKASKSLKSVSKGHGAEKKGAGESGADKKSVLGN